MKEIGNILGVAESRVCQINAATLRHLRVGFLLRQTPTNHDRRKHLRNESASAGRDVEARVSFLLGFAKRSVYGKAKE